MGKNTGFIAVNNTALSSDEGRAKKSYNCLDLAKFVCAFLIIAIHVPPLSDISPAANEALVFVAARLAVPFYFIASGYFLFRKSGYEEFDSSVVSAYCWRLFKLYIIWYAVYLPENIYSTFCMEHYSFWTGAAVIVRGFLFCGYRHLWYLQASIIAALSLLFLIKKKMKLSNILLAGIILYLAGLLGQDFFVLIEPARQIPFLWGILKFLQCVFVTTRNGFCEGILFMGIGLMFACRPVIMRMRTAVLAFAASMLLSFAEVFTAGHFGWYLAQDYFLALAPASFFLFYVLSHIELRDSPVYYELRVGGMLIYYVHIFVRTCMNLAIRLIKSRTGLNLDIALGKFLFVCAASCGAAFLASSLSRRKHFRWLKHFY